MSPLAHARPFLVRRPSGRGIWQPAGASPDPVPPGSIDARSRLAGRTRRTFPHPLVARRKPDRGRPFAGHTGQWLSAKLRQSWERHCLVDDRSALAPQPWCVEQGSQLLPPAMRWQGRRPSISRQSSLESPFNMRERRSDVLPCKAQTLLDTQNLVSGTRIATASIRRPT